MLFDDPLGYAKLLLQLYREGKASFGSVKFNLSDAVKKGIVCRLNCQFVNSKDPILDYTAEHSYVIDFDEIIDKNELLKMFRNSFSNFEEKFEFRKLGTILQNEKLRPLDETVIDLESVLPLLV